MRGSGPSRNFFEAEHTCSMIQQGRLKTLIVGCGYIGSATARALRQRGDEVVGITRGAESAESLRRDGIEPIAADITLLESLRHISPRFDAIVFSVSSGRRGEDAYREVYLKGTVNLLEWLRSSPPSIIVYTGSTTVYAQTDGGWVDESSPTEPPHASGKILLETEQMLLQSGVPAVVLRLAGIYGPDRHAMLDKLRAGTSVLPGDGTHIINMAHRDDIVTAILAALDRKPAGQVFNVVDDEPVREADYVRWLCDRLCLPMVQFEPDAEPSFKAGMRKGFQANRRISNAKLKEKLGVVLQYPSFREGLMSLLAERAT